MKITFIKILFFLPLGIISSESAHAFLLKKECKFLLKKNESSSLGSYDINLKKSGRCENIVLVLNVFKRSDGWWNIYLGDSQAFVTTVIDGEDKAYGKFVSSKFLTDKPIILNCIEFASGHAIDRSCNDEESRESEAMHFTNSISKIEEVKKNEIIEITFRYR